MHTSNADLTKSQKFVIFAVTFGSILEWYDIYLYVYWAPIISSLFFKQNSQFLNTFNTVLLFSVGFIFRPLGGIFFGHLGDRIGRKQTFILTIILMTIPTFVLGLLPVYDQIGIFAPIFLAIIRILQTFPAGGEIPGVFCYLYENSSQNNKKFMTSFAGVGNQIGILLSALECFLFEIYFTEEFLIEWGWRISFIVGGFIGLSGYYLRYKLHETKLFHEMVLHHKMSKKSLLEILKIRWKSILTGISYGAAQTGSFHLVSILFPVYIYRAIGIDPTKNFIASIIFIGLMTLPLPIYGLIGDRFGVKKILIGSCIGMICLLYPLHVAISDMSTQYMMWIMGMYVLCFTSITAYWPYLISNLFPTSDRYTCTGLSFNIADGVFGGLTTLIALYILEASGDIGSFVWILLICCIMSLVSFIKIKTSN